MPDTQKYQFRYVRTAAGTLPGRDFILQTEAAITDIGNTALDNTEEALENSRQALENSENALSIANSAQSDASLALTVAYDARERAINAADAAAQAQSTADQAVTDAAAAQTAADKAQSTADYAQETAEDALELARTANTAAENAQNTADNAETKAEAAQETADSAQCQADTNSDLIADLGTELTNAQTRLEAQINSTGFWFEYDDTSTSLEFYGSGLAKKYLTEELTDGPEGTKAPYWFWNFVREDGKGCVQWLRTSDGTIYSREGVNESYEINAGMDSLDLVAFSDATATLTLTAGEDGSLMWSGSGGTISSQSQGTRTAVCTVVVDLSAIPETGDITLNGTVLASLTSEGIAHGTPYEDDYCTVSLDSSTINETESTVTMTLVGEWTDYEEGESTWSDWATLAGGGSGDSTPTGTVIAYMGDDIPDGYLVCNGAEVSRTEYAALYAVIGDSCGTATQSDCFVLPDSRDKFLMGSGTNSPGAEIAAGLPEVYGQTRGLRWRSNMNSGYNLGAFTQSTYVDEDHMDEGGVEGTSWGSNYFYFYASDDDSIYGASYTVQPLSVVVRELIKV